MYFDRLYAPTDNELICNFIKSHHNIHQRRVILTLAAFAGCHRAANSWPFLTPSTQEKIGNFSEPHMCQSGLEDLGKNAKNAELFQANACVYNNGKKMFFVITARVLTGNFLSRLHLAHSSRDMYPSSWRAGCYESVSKPLLYVSFRSEMLMLSGSEKKKGNLQVEESRSILHFHTTFELEEVKADQLAARIPEEWNSYTC